MTPEQLKRAIAEADHRQRINEQEAEISSYLNALREMDRETIFAEACSLYNENRRLEAEHASCLKSWDDL